MRRYILFFILALTPALAEDEPLQLNSGEDNTATFEPEEGLLQLQSEENDIPIQLAPPTSPFQPKAASLFEDPSTPSQETEVTRTELAEEPTGGFVDKVVLSALDKVTARVSHLT